MTSEVELPRRGPGRHFEGDLRRTLIDAAVSAIADNGIDAVSLRDVARRAGVSHAAPAHHFGDKAGLYTAIATEGFTLLAERLDDLAAETETVDWDAPTERPVEQLVQIGRAYVDFAATHPAHFEVMFRPSLFRIGDPDLIAASDRAYGGLRRVVEACRAAGWGRGVDATTLAGLAWAHAHGFGALRSQGALGRYVPDVTLDGVTEMLRVFAIAMHDGPVVPPAD